MGRLGPGMVVVFPGESVPELEPEPGLLHLVPSPAPPPRCLWLGTAGDSKVLYLHFVFSAF